MKRSEGLFHLAFETFRDCYHYQTYVQSKLLQPQHAFDDVKFLGVIWNIHWNLWSGLSAMKMPSVQSNFHDILILKKTGFKTDLSLWRAQSHPIFSTPSAMLICQLLYVGFICFFLNHMHLQFQTFAKVISFFSTEWTSKLICWEPIFF